MQEEYHGIANSGGIVSTAKQLYGWGTISVNVWLPSLSELVGIDAATYNENYGTHYSAMQGLNVSVGSSWPYIDVKGGSQFAYFKQYNASGGGAKIFDACKQESAWTRTPDFGQNHSLIAFSSANGISSNRPATASHAVLVGTNSVSFTMVIKGITIAYSLHCPSSPQKGTARRTAHL